MANIKSIGGNPIVPDQISGGATEGNYALLTAGAALGITGEATDSAAWLQRVSTSDGPTTVRSIHGNTIVEDGALVPVNMTGIETTGFNQFDPANVRTNIFINGATGKIAGGIDTQTAVVEVFPNTDYCLTYTGGNRCIIAGVDSMAPAVGDDARVIFNTGSRVSPKVFNTGDNRYVACFIATSAAPATDICVNISDPTRNGQYEPYWHQERTIHAATYFPNGMRSAGTVRDELTSTEAITRVGVVDLGTLTYTDNGVTGGVQKFLAKGITDKAIGETNITSGKFDVLISATPWTMWGRDSNNYVEFKVPENMYTTDTFKTALSGVMLHYALATPTTTPIDPPLNLTYRTAAGGTERVMVPTGENSAPPIIVAAQGYTAESLRDAALAAIAPVENGLASTNYGVGSYLVHGGQLCKVTTAIATGEAISIGTNVTATTVMAEVIALIAQ